MGAVLSADGLKIEGIAFPDPEPPLTSMRFSVLVSTILALQEVRYDDATGTGTVAVALIIWFKGGNVIVPDSFENVMALWVTPPPSGQEPVE